jgi:VWFA-related protein
MKRASLVLPLMFAVAGGLPAADDDKSDVVFRSDVSLVRVDVQVVDRDNRAITGLRVGDFILKDEGKVRPITNFARENMPVDVLFLFDVSASMGPHVRRIANAAHDALRVLGDKDRVGIMVFDRVTRLRSPFRSSHDEVESALNAMLRQENFRGGTDITRGLLDAADYVRRQARKDARRAIIILTDDQTERDRDEAAVGRALDNANAVLMALIAPDALANRGYGGRRGGMGGGGMGGGGMGVPGMGGPLGGIILGRRNGPYGGGPGMGGGSHTQSAGTSEIARDSGGDSLPVDDASALETTLNRIRQRYALFFNMPAGVRPGQERSISVELADAAYVRYPGAELRFRRTYFTPDGPEETRTHRNGRDEVAPEPATAAVATENSDTVVVTPTAASSEAPAPLPRRRAISEPSSSSGPNPNVGTPERPDEQP